MLKRFSLLAALLLASWRSLSAADDPYRYWFLIHDQAVVEDLKLSSAEQAAVQKEIDELDGRFMPLRGTNPETVARELPPIIAEAQQRLHKVLKPDQERRLAEIVLRVQGPSALLRGDIAPQMKFTADQKKKLEKITGDTQKGIEELEKKQSEGKESMDSLQKEALKLRTDEQADVLKLLSKPQQATWRKLAGSPFDAARLGQMRFKAPELTEAKVWINSQPLTLSELRGKVVALHFYTFGCINCIHNYPWYREWHEAYKEKGLIVLGIHAPESDGEKVVESIQKKAREEKLLFPIVVDSDKKNWNAWGNSMWPTIYLIDKQGYMRTYWMGELKWQGTDGEKIIREQIEKLLAEEE